MEDPISKKALIWIVVAGVCSAAAMALFLAGFFLMPPARQEGRALRPRQEERRSVEMHRRAARGISVDPSAGRAEPGRHHESGRGTGESRGTQPVRTHPSALDSRPVFYSLVTIDFDSPTGAARMQQEGAVGVDRSVAIEDGTIAYQFGYETLTTIDGSGRAMEETLNQAVLWRDPEIDRFAGGDDAMRAVAVLANAALDQLGERFIADGSVQQFVFRYPREAPLMPEAIRYRVQGRQQRDDILGEVVTVTATTEPFSLTLSDGRSAHAVSHLFCVMDSSMEMTYLQVVRFEVRVGNETLVLEKLLILDHENAPIPLHALEGDLLAGFHAIGLSQEPERAAVSPSAPLPAWVPEVLVGAGVSEILAGAAIEGRPNFVITATIGSILLLDAAVSAGTTLMKEAGWINWAWRGVLHEAGQGLGWGIAHGYNAVVPGAEADPDQWGDVGGIAGDVLSLFVPKHVAAHGVTATLKWTSKGVRARVIPRTIDLAGRQLRISKRGIEIIRMKRWAAPAFRHNVLESVRWGVSALRLSVRAANYAFDWYSRRSAVAPPRLGDVSFRLYWRPSGVDIDLHVIDPEGEHIYFRNMRSSSGGQLDRDDRTGGGPENVFWPSGQAPAGTYRAWAHYYAGSGTRQAVLEIREGPHVVKTRTFTLNHRGDKSAVMTWHVE